MSRQQIRNLPNEFHSGQFQQVLKDHVYIGVVYTMNVTMPIFDGNSEKRRGNEGRSLITELSARFKSTVKSILNLNFDQDIQVLVLPTRNFLLPAFLYIR